MIFPIVTKRFQANQQIKNAATFIHINPYSKPVCPDPSTNQNT